MRMRLKTRNTLKGLAFVSPWIVGFLLFTLVPLGRTFWFSLNEVRFTAEGIKTRFLGWLNYKNAFLLDVSFTDILVEYLWQTVVNTPIILVFSLIVAMLLNRNLKGKGVFRTLFFLPVVITSGPVMQQLLDQQATALPGLERFLSPQFLQQNLPAFLVEPVSFLFSSFIMILWFSGVPILIFLAGLQKLDRNMYEAASIDGASRWQMFWKLTLPALNPVIVVNVLFTVVTLSAFPLNPVVSKISGDMYKVEKGIGFATAMAWIYFAALLLVLGGLIAIVRRRERGVRGS